MQRYGDVLLDRVAKSAVRYGSFFFNTGMIMTRRPLCDLSVMFLYGWYILGYIVVSHGLKNRSVSPGIKSHHIADCMICIKKMVETILTGKLLQHLFRFWVVRLKLPHSCFFSILTLLQQKE